MRIPVLKIRDENGNLIPINAIRGDKGKSAYEQVVDGGYTGTEEEFIDALTGLTKSEIVKHRTDLNNPHGVTAEQVGAISKTGGEMTGGLNVYGNLFASDLTAGTSFKFDGVNYGDLAHADKTATKFATFDTSGYLKYRTGYETAIDLIPYIMENGDIVRFQTGYYTGTGIGGAGIRTEISLNFAPMLVIIYGEYDDYNSRYFSPMVITMPTTISYDSTINYYGSASVLAYPNTTGGTPVIYRMDEAFWYNDPVWGAHTLAWFHSGDDLDWTGTNYDKSEKECAARQKNTGGKVYHYIAIG